MIKSTVCDHQNIKMFGVYRYLFPLFCYKCKLPCLVHLLRHTVAISSCNQGSRGNDGGGGGNRDDTIVAVAAGAGAV